jgi:hypothetical protein
MSRFAAIVLGKTPPAACRCYSPVADALAELIFSLPSLLPFYHSTVLSNYKLFTILSVYHP